MKREFLEQYGLEKEQIDAILDENSKDIGKAKGDVEALTTELEDYKTQLAERDADIEALSKQTGNNAELQTKITELQDKYEADTEALSQKVTETKLNSAIELALTKAGARNIKAAKALLDYDNIKVTDEGIDGLDNQIESISKSDDYLFGSGESTGSIISGGNPTGGAGANDADAFADAVSKYT